MRSDYALYGVAVIFFIMTGLVLAYSLAYVFEFRELWILTTAVLGLAFIGIGYTQRPKSKTISTPTHTVTSSTSTPRKPSAVELITPNTMKERKADTGAQTDLSAKGLSRIKGIGEKRVGQLRTLGINTIEDLASARPRQLTGKMKITTKTAKKWIQNANEAIEKS